MKNKLLLMICMITIWFLVGSKARAADDMLEIAKNTALPSDAYTYNYVYWDDAAKRYELISVTRPLFWESSSFRIRVEGTSGAFRQYILKPNGNSYYWYGYSSGSNNGLVWGMKSPTHLVKASHDVLYLDDNTKIFFQGPPKPSPLVQAMTKAEMKGAMTEVLSLIPIVLVSLAGFLGLRKALSMVSGILRKS